MCPAAACQGNLWGDVLRLMPPISSAQLEASQIPLRNSRKSLRISNLWAMNGPRHATFCAVGDSVRNISATLSSQYFQGMEDSCCRFDLTNGPVTRRLSQMSLSRFAVLLGGAPPPQEAAGTTRPITPPGIRFRSFSIVVKYEGVHRVPQQETRWKNVAVKIF